MDQETHCRKTYQDRVDTLSSILKEIHYVPRYQRDYDWDIENCDDLFEDLQKFHKNKKTDGNSKYLFGQFVSYNGIENKLYILDGQQRLTTATLFIAAIRNILIQIIKSTPYDERLNEEAVKLKEHLMYHILSEPDSKDKPLFNVYKDNKKLMDAIITNADRDIIDSIPLNNVSQHNLKNNYFYFFDKFCNLIGIHKNEFGSYPEDAFKLKREQYRPILEYCRTFLDFKVCSVYCLHLDEAYELFEAINNRGINLKTLDLLKNHIYGKCYTDDKSLIEDESQIEDKWKNITENLEYLSSGTKEKYDKYIRYYLNSTSLFTRRSDIYPILVRNISNKMEALHFIDEFTDAITLFKLIFKSDNSTIELDEQSKRILKGLSHNKFDSYCPALLSVYLKNKNNPEILKKRIRSILDAYDYLYVINIVPEIQKTNSFEETTSHIAINYYNSDGSDNAFNEMLKTIYDLREGSNELIKSTYKTRPMKKTNAVKYILTEIFNRSGDSTIDCTVVDLEHILPQSTDKIEERWKPFTIDKHKEYVDRIGNMLILNSKVNRSIKNKSYDEKKKWYQTTEGGSTRKKYSDIQEDKFLVTTWTPDTIDERSEFIIQKIIELWPNKPCA